MKKLWITRNAYSKLLVLFAFAVLPNSAFAGSLTSAFSIYALYDAGSGSQGFLVTPASPATVDNTGSACTYNDGYALAASDVNYKEKVALLTAAFLANRQVKLFLTHNSGDCVFSRPRLDNVIIYN